MIALIKSYGTYIAYGAIALLVVSGVYIIYRAGYKSCDADVKQAVNESLVNDKKEADNVRMDEQRISSDGIDDALASIGILRD